MPTYPRSPPIKQRRAVNPDAASAAAMGINLMDAARRRQAIAAGLAQGASWPRAICDARRELRQRKLHPYVEPWGMLALLLAVALIALTALVLLLAGVVAAIVTGIVLLNVFAVLLGLRSRGARTPAVALERWRPSSFRRLPEPPLVAEEDADELTVRRR